MDERFYLRQLKAGRDFGVGNPIAAQMENFVYLLGDKVSRECLVVDPAWDVGGIIDVAAADDMTITGALVTHWHPDHVGGDLFGHHVGGLAELMTLNPCKVHIHKEELQFTQMMTGLSRSDFELHSSGDKVAVGEVEVECLHTPGHTAGSQCFRCAGALVAGDTLFLQGCGRLDLPTADVDQMWDTLTKRLASLPSDLTLFPGHDYSHKPHATLEEVRQTNPYLQVPNLDTWRRMMGR